MANTEPTWNAGQMSEARCHEHHVLPEKFERIRELLVKTLKETPLPSMPRSYRTVNNVSRCMSQLPTDRSMSIVINNFSVATISERVKTNMIRND